MAVTDWISLAQALLLAVTAAFAWRALVLSISERQDARDAAAAARVEAAKAPLRVLLGDVIRELKDLAAVSEERVPGVGIRLDDQIAAKQRRLAIALAFTPPDVFNLFSTRDLTTCSTNDVSSRRIEDATNELLRCFAEIEAGQFSIAQVALPAQRAVRQVQPSAQHSSDAVDQQPCTRLFAARTNSAATGSARRAHGPARS